MARIKIEGADKLKKKFKAKEKKSRRLDDGSVSVGYRGVDYVLYVHEIKNPSSGIPRRGKGAKGNYWDVGEPKFLEKPFRQNRKEYVRRIRLAYKNGASVVHALLIGGLALQRDSQLLAPVDTGNLKGSAFTEIDK
jgi:hypothetical protein